MRPTTAAVAAAKTAAAVKPGKHDNRIPTAGLTADVTDGRSQAAAVSAVKMPVYYPRLILDNSAYCFSITANCPLEIPSPGSYPRAYTIHDQQGRPHAAYFMTLELNPTLGEYYGVQGTTWQHPPILARQQGLRTVAGKRLELFAEGGKLTDVAWRTPQGVYWISNTLTSNIGSQQMVGMAASLTRASP
jgi:hypothetical protein